MAKEPENFEDEIVDADSISENQGAIALPSDVLPTTLHLLPMTDRPFFPAQTMPLLMDETPWMDTVKLVGESTHHVVGLTLLKAEQLENANAEDFYKIGTAVRMHQPMSSSGKIQFIAEGLQRFKIVKWLSTEPPYRVQVEYPEGATTEPTSELRAYAMAIINTIKELLPLNPLYSEELKLFLHRFSPNEPSLLADFAASLTTSSGEDLQEILDTVPIQRRVEKVLLLLKKELEVAKLQTKIRAQVEDKITDQQRRFFLKQQLKEIQQELGIAKDDRTADIERFEQRLEALTLPEQAEERIEDEMQKLGILESGSPEYAVTRNYLDWLTNMPWGKYSKDKLNLDRARKILDEDHDGLEDVKDRIIEFLAVGALKGEIAGSIVLLVGPPGVGKTSIGNSIARALGRKFYRFSLGGMRDEAEIKGHRRTYIGAMPGKIVQAVKEAGVANPLIMLDEIDKVGASYQGDPASALLEVLDPEQNSSFLDHYLDVRFDLSKCLFVCTANQLDTIPKPLLDRMETIRLSGYITAEKITIAKHHLLPKQLEKTGIKPSKLKISDAALRKIVDGYAREAGVRGLEKQLGRIARKSVVEFVKGRKNAIRIGIGDVEERLGKPLFQPEKLMSGVGIVTGLAWTAMGGVTLPVEATLVHRTNRGLKLTGQLGSVMQESATIAYSYINSQLGRFAAKEDFFDSAFIHLHVPEGATPKDGPSAGVTMATALLSLATGRKVRNLAMTGELTLTGKVLPVGGIREKVIAAKRIKIRELILPAANQRDFDELPEHISKGLNAHFVSDFSEVADLVLKPHRR